MKAGERNAIIVGAGLLAFLVFTLAEPPAEAALPAKLPPPDPPNPKTPPSDDSPDDETALARMLASETENYGARVVVGWITLQSAKRRKVSLYERLTDGQGYGPRVKNGVRRYASTEKPPNREARQLAKRLLTGDIEPSAKIRALGISAWVEDLRGTEASATELLRNQTGSVNFGGIWARLRGSRWYLYHASKPALSWKAGQAQKALAAVEAIDALDRQTPNA